MSLYHDAATILSSPSSLAGSLRSRVYDRNNNNNIHNTTLKSSPALIYALISECAKWDTILAEVIDNAGILSQEPKLNPLLALLLCHDHLLAKKGIACPQNHPLRQAIERHKSRLASELTKARLRRKCPTMEALRLHLQGIEGMKRRDPQPRWVRINQVKTSVEEELARLPFSEFTEVTTLAELGAGEDKTGGGKAKAFFRDPDIPRLLATNATTIQLTTSSSYDAGRIILQDKASCFPAHLLLNSKPKHLVPAWGGGGRIDRRSDDDDDSTDDSPGDVLDACAAPGNKTSHIFSILGSRKRWLESNRKIFACERDAARSETLQKMLDRAGGEAGSRTFDVLAKQDFLALDPLDVKFCRVTQILLDPSCSGSGILGRQDVPVLVLPKGRSAANGNGGGRYKHSGGLKREPAAVSDGPGGNEHDARSGRPIPSNKRKRTAAANPSLPSYDVSAEANVLPTSISDPSTNRRVQTLSNLQTHLLTHAFSFPHASLITYSTCSVHVLENELVALRALNHTVAKTRGWRLLSRDEQADGMRNWRTRGAEVDGGDERWAQMSADERADFREACIRCEGGGEDATMGFFVVGFVRDPMLVGVVEKEDINHHDEWEGISN